MLIENTFFGEVNKVEQAISRIQFAYEVSRSRGLGALYVAFSGGKDSVTIAKLVEMAGVPYELHYSKTGIDPPEVIYFMREHYPNTVIEPFKKSMWQLIVGKKMPPTRIMRYCCEELKEGGGNGKVVIMGVRWAESVKRAKSRNVFETKASTVTKKALLYDNTESREIFKYCMSKRGYIVNPIVDWTNGEVWEFIKQYNVPYCKLYDQGVKRIGCIGCPLGGRNHMADEFERYPRFKKLYILAFDKMLKRVGNDKRTWKTGEDVFNWWVYGKQESFDLLDD